MLMLLLFLCANYQVLAQDNSGVIVSGRVIDDSGMPLPGATVIEAGTTNGVVTDINGNFEIEVSGMGSEISVSYFGFQTKTIAADKEFVEIVLLPDTAALEEVILIGYGESRKKDLTGSITAIDLDDIQTQPSSNIGEAIQGRAPGVRIITSGRPGSNPTIRIRGTGTIGNNDPLIVVDGLPLNGGLNQVNMKDVASLQILKDASATAIYGARGANGVVIISTKRGSGSGKGQLNIDAFSAIQTTTNMIDVLNAQQYARLSNEMLVNAGYEPNPAFSNPQALGEGTDWLDAFFTEGMQNSLTLSYSKAGEGTNLYTSLNAFDQEGVVINTNYTRYIFQLNSDTEISDNLRFGNSLKLNYDIKENGEINIQNAYLSLPTQPIFSEDEDYSGPVGQPIYSGDTENPIGKANIVDISTKGYNIQGSVFGELDLLEHFTFKTFAGAEANLWFGRTWSPSFSWDSDVQPNAYLFESANRSVTLLWDNTLSYETEFNERSSITAVIGTSAQENEFRFISGSVQNFPSEQTQELNNGIDQTVLNGSGSEWALFSYFARVQGDFRDKYYLTATVRRDGSSRFGDGNKFGTFPSASAAWRISEDFFENSQTISDLKLRIGYGITGNQKIGNYSFSSAYNTNLYNFNGNFVTAVVPTVLPNSNVQWESQEQFNIGLDASLFGRAVDVTIDLYRKDTEDMLVPQSVPVTSGYSDIYVPFINAGKIRNQGFEAIITSYNFLRENFTWTTDFVFSYNENEVININSETPLTTGGIGLNYNLARIQPGYPVNVFYGFVQQGIFQTREEVENAAVQVPGENPATSTAPGDIRFQDLNNDGVINDADRTIIGNPNPDFIYSLNNTFRIGNFDLNIYIQGIHGNDIFNATRLYTENMAVITNQSTEVLERWTGPGTSSTMPRAIYGDPNNNIRPSTRYIEDGSYLRLKNISLAFNIPVENFASGYFKSSKIYFSGQNLLTITDYSGLDPEVGANGIDLNNYPLTKTFSLGVNLTF